MMNEILWDLINTGRVASFINDIIIGMEREEGYDKLVEEVIKRLAENDLYVHSRVQKSSERKRIQREAISRGVQEGNKWDD